MNKDIMKVAGFGKQVELVENSQCPFCKKKINPNTEFKDELSRKEFGISGLCQECQDNTFDDCYDDCYDGFLEDDEDERLCW